MEVKWRPKDVVLSLWENMLKWRNWSCSNSNDSYVLAILVLPSTFLTAYMRSQSRYTRPDQRRVPRSHFPKCFSHSTSPRYGESVKTCPTIVKVLQAWRSNSGYNDTGCARILYVVRLSLKRIQFGEFAVCCGGRARGEHAVQLWRKIKT